MSTLALSKANFLKSLSEQLNEDDIILFTQDLEGNLSVSKNNKTKKMTFAYSADAFTDKGIGHIAFGKTPVFSFCLCKKTDVTPKVHEILGL